MVKLQQKKPILIGVISAAVLLLAAGILLLLLLLPGRKADPRSLLAKATALSEQNLCLTALLEEDPQDEESWRRLLVNYQILGADALTQQATAQAAATALGHEITPAEETDSAPEEPGSVIGTGGIVHGGLTISDYPGANALVTDGETVYLAMSDGLYADYHGIRVRLHAARAERLIAAENGLYYLGGDGLVRYIARDGHKTTLLSAVQAADFAWLGGDLWIAGTDGALYKNDQRIESTLPASTLCTAGVQLFACGGEGLFTVDDSGAELLLSSAVSAPVGGSDGCVYYIQENGYPARYDPAAGEAVILTEEEAVALGCSEGRIYYRNNAGKIRKCG